MNFLKKQKTYKITILYEDAIRADNIDDAWEKFAWEVLPKIQDFSDCTKIELCDEPTYQEYTRG